MKILHISYSLNEQSAGYRLAYAQAVHQGHDIHFLLARKSSSPFISSKRISPLLSGFLGFGSHLLDHLVNRLLLKRGEIFSMGIGLPFKNMIFERLILKAKPDVVHVHWGGYGFIPVTLLKRLSKNDTIRVVVTTHDYHYFTGGCHIPMDCPEHKNNCRTCPMSSGFLGMKWISQQRQQAKNSLLNSPIVFVSPSFYTASFIKAALGGINAQVIANTAGSIYALDNNELNQNMELYAKYRASNNNIPTLLVVGVKSSARQNKGSDILKELTTRMSSEGKNFNLITVGEYIDLNISGTHLHYNSQSIAELKQLYAVADLCIVPSRFETFSQVTLESIQSATPVVAFDLTGPADIIKDGVSGFLVKSFDMDEFCARVIENLNYKFTHQELMVRSALETAEQFSPDKIADLYQEIYRMTIAQPMIHA